MTSLVADGALYREANLQKLAQTHLKWITRVPVPVSAAHKRSWLKSTRRP
jgi:transposase